LRSDTAQVVHVERHRINPGRLRLELLRRGLDGQTFARQAGISAATVSHILNGRMANPRTISKLALTLVRIPPLAGLEGNMLELVPVGCSQAAATESGD
jgi:transcriptional regulator with XRE-family HTH domain